MQPTIRTLIVDDHAIVREGLRFLLDEEPSIDVVGEAANGVEAVSMAKKHQPDVILMDLVMPKMDGLTAIGHVADVSPDSQVLVLTSFADDRKVHDAVKSGAIGYLLKDVLRPDLIRAIHAAADGRPTLHPEAQRQLMRQVTHRQPPSQLDSLTRREKDVLKLIAAGMSNKLIARELHLTEGTVKGYVSAILAKLDVSDRTQAALYAVKHGLDDSS